MVLLSFEKEFYSKRKEFFPFRADPFSEGYWSKKSRRHKVVPLVKNGIKFTSCIESPEIKILQKLALRISSEDNH